MLFHAVNRLNGCASLLLISPLAGNAAIRSRTVRPAFFLSGTPVRPPAATGYAAVAVSEITEIVVGAHFAT